MCTQRMHLQAFEAFKPVECRVVMEKEDPAKSRGFGFVTFGNSGDAEKAHAELNGKEIDGRTVRTDFAGDSSRKRRRR
jgi:cold-inducible RNA-binding protein